MRSIRWISELQSPSDRPIDLYLHPCSSVLDEYLIHSTLLYMHMKKTPVFDLPGAFGVINGNTKNGVGVERSIPYTMERPPPLAWMFELLRYLSSWDCFNFLTLPYLVLP